MGRLVKTKLCFELFDEAGVNTPGAARIVADLNIGATECSSCKMQMEQGTTTPTLHPIKLLALAYGLMPEIREKLKPTKGNLKVS